MNEIKFVLDLIDQGATTDQIRAFRKHFWNEGRLDMRSATIQSLLLAGNLNFESLAKAATELEKKNTPAPTPVMVVKE